MVLVGPVLKNRQKQARNSQTQIMGKLAFTVSSMKGKPTHIAMPETRK